MLMELCISELEDVAREPQLLNSAHPVVEESPHPYPDNAKFGRVVHIPGAEALLVSFDSNCSTERRHDVLTIKDGGGAVIAVRSGHDPLDWSNDVRIVGDTLQWSFESDGSVNGWGFRFTIQPLLPETSKEVQLSDRILQSRPSIDLVTCLLDFQLDANPTDESIGRLGAALASCAQLNILDACQRTWAIQQLRKLINSPMGTVLNGGAIAPEDDSKQVMLIFIITCALLCCFRVLDHCPLYMLYSVVFLMLYWNSISMSFLMLQVEVSCCIVLSFRYTLMLVSVYVIVL